MLNSEPYCRVCGYEPVDPPWGGDGRSPGFEMCPSCGVEWGYQDATVKGALRYRLAWVQSGAAWFDPGVPHDNLSVEARLRNVEWL
jgi:hypothetical protein